MQTLLLPSATRTGIAPPSLNVSKPSPLNRSSNTLSFTSSSHRCLLLTSSSSLFSDHSQYINPNKLASHPVTVAYASSRFYESSRSDIVQASKRLESTSRSFKRLGSLGFWLQLVCTVVSATILSFSVVITGNIPSPVTFYATTGGIAAAFLSSFWSFGYIRLAARLRKAVNDPSKAPPRADVVTSLKNGIALNLLGMGAAILGMQATVGMLVAKALTVSANPYRSGGSPVLALDVFLVQASANTILSHFLGLLFTVELLRLVTFTPSESVSVPKVSF